MKRFSASMPALTLAAAAGALLALSNDALAAPLLKKDQAVALQQSTDPFSALVGKKRERRAARNNPRSVQRYVLASDDRAFLFEEHANGALITFLCGSDDPRIDCSIDPEKEAAEIYQLAATRGPRGDIIYKNAEDDTLLRIASYGGATVFWPGDGRGYAASKSFGDDASLVLPRIGLAAAQRRARAATALISALTGAPIIFELASKAGPNQETAVLADAIVRAAAGLHMVANDPTGARIIASRIQKVSFIEDISAGVSLEEAVLTIRYVPDQDIQGRPSSRGVAQYLEETL